MAAVTSDKPEPPTHGLSDTEILETVSERNASTKVQMNAASTSDKPDPTSLDLLGIPRYTLPTRLQRTAISSPSAGHPILGLASGCAKIMSQCLKRPIR